MPGKFGDVNTEPEPGVMENGGLAIQGESDITGFDQDDPATVCPQPSPTPAFDTLDNNLATVDIVASGRYLDQRHDNGRIWIYTSLDNNPATVQLVADEHTLYQRHNAGKIWVYTGTQLTDVITVSWYPHRC